MKIWYGTFLIALYASSSFAIDCPGNQGKKYNKNTINKSLNCIDSGLKALEQSGASMSGSVGTLQADVGSLKSDVSTLKSTIGGGGSDLSARVAAAESRIGNVEKGLAQAESDVAFLKGRTPQPLVMMYEDDLLKVEISGLSKSTDANRKTRVRLAFLAKNKTAQPLLLGHHSKTTVSDDNGTSCLNVQLTGLPAVNTNYQPTNYASIAPNSALAFVWDSTATCDDYTGYSFNMSTEMMRYDSASSFGVPFTISFTGLPIPPR